MANIDKFKKITATFEIITPMFIGGGFTESDSIRPTSVKGALRFWWRALVWSQLIKNYKTQESAIDALHAQEIELFGSAVKDTKGGQGKVSVRVKQVEESDYKNIFKGEKYKQGISYLLGQGLSDFKSGLLRNAIKPKQNFIVELVLKGVSEQQQCELADTLLCFGLIGTLGARARKGFGSVAIETLVNDGENVTLPQNIEEYKNTLKSLWSNVNNAQSLAPFTAFSAHMLSDISCQKNNFEAVLNEVGTKQQLYRSYGSGGKVNGQKALQLFKDDHDAIYDIAEGRFTMHPKRLVFGAPHNYFLSSGSKVNVEVTVAATNKNRRASPLFVHVHKFGEQYYAIQTLLPAQFSFENSAVEYKIKKKSPIKKTLSEKDIDWSVITDYLTLKEYKGHNESSEGFVNREAIFAGDKR